MKANVTYSEQGKEKSILFEAIDMETIRAATNQWRVKESRLRKTPIKILHISDPIMETGDNKKTIQVF